jgi:hypothetical protein
VSEQKPEMVFVTCERQLKAMAWAIFGAPEGLFGNRISVGWPSEEWWDKVAFPRCVVLVDGWQEMRSFRASAPEKRVAVEGEDYVRAWYRDCEAAMSCLIAIQAQGQVHQTETGEITGISDFTGSVKMAIRPGLVFPVDGDWAGEYRVATGMRCIDKEPEANTAGRMFERQMRFEVRGPIYRVVNEYVARTLVINATVNK